MAETIRAEQFTIYAKKEIEKTIAARLPKAQYALDSQIWADMLPYIPMQTGIFKNMLAGENAALAGSGQVVIYDGVYGRYLYFGKVMVDSATGKGARPITLPSGELIFRHRLGAKLIPSGRKLTYSQPTAQAEWYEVAKAERYADWIGIAAKVLQNG